MDEPSTKEQAIELMATRLASKCGRGQNSPLDWDQFVELSGRISSFNVPSTTFTPEMCGLIWALSRLLAPEVTVGLGTHVGYTFAWLAGNSEGASASSRFYAVDVDSGASALAEQNLRNLGFGPRLEVVCEDGHRFLRRIDKPIDLLYIDVDHPTQGKRAYASLLQNAMNQLSSGGVVLAHDPCVPKFKRDLKPFFDLIESSDRLADPWILRIDPCGLAVIAVL